MKNTQSKFSVYIVSGALIFASILYGVSAATTWKGPASSPTNVTDIDSALDLSNFISKSRLQQQQTQAPVTIYNNGNYLARTGTATTTKAFTTVVDIAGSVGFENATVIGSDGFPFTVYQDAGTNGLRFIHCLNLTCSNHDAPGSIADSTAYQASVAIGTDGFPIIAYPLNTVALKVIHCKNISCSTSDAAVSLDTTGNAGTVSMAIGQDGRPIIGYNGDLRLKVAHCNDAACLTGATIVLVDASPTLRYVSLALAPDGLPVISYIDVPNTNLKIAKCTSFDCSTSNISIMGDSANAINQMTSIAVPSDGLPVISYYDGTLLAVKVSKCGNASCSSGNTITVIDNSVGNYDVGADTSLALSASDGLPIVAYWRRSTDDLVLTKCGNAACSSGNVTNTVDAGPVGRWSYLVTGSDGLPVISYYDSSGSDLKMAKCYNDTCSSAIITNYYGVIGTGKSGVPNSSYLPSLPLSGTVGVYGYAEGGAGNYGIYGYSSTGVGVGGSATAANDYAGLFYGPVRIRTGGAGTVRGTLQSPVSIEAGSGFIANNSQDYAVQLNATTARNESRAIEGMVVGPSTEGIGVAGWALSNYGINVTAINETQAVLGQSGTLYGVYGYSDNGTGVIGDGARLSSTLLLTKGVYGESYDYGVWGKGIFTLIGNEYLSGSGYGTATTTQSGVGIYACGTTYAAQFHGDVRVIGTLQMGIGLDTLVENPNTSDIVTGRIIKPSVTLTEQQLIQISNAAVAGGYAGAALTTLP